MKTSQRGFHRVTTFVLLTSFGLSALLPAPVRAEVRGEVRETSYRVQQSGAHLYTLVSEQGRHELELIPGDGSLVRIDGRAFTFDFSRSRFVNEKRLQKFLNFEFRGRRVVSRAWSERFLNFWVPTAHAELLPWIFGSLALAGVVTAIVYNNKSKKLDDQRQHRDGREHRHSDSKDENAWWKPRHWNLFGNDQSNQDSVECETNSSTH